MNSDFILSKEIEYLIAAEHLQAGDHLPSERELCERFGVQRLTIRSALHILQNEGLIFSKPKSGYFLCAPKIVKNATRISSLTDLVFNPSSGNRTEILEMKVIEANKEQMEFLRCLIGEPFYYLERLRYIGDIPVCLDVSYVSKRLCPDLSAEELSKLSLYDILSSRYQINLTGSEQFIDVIRPDERIASLLQLTSLEQMIHQHGYVFDHKNRLVEYSDSYMNRKYFRYES